MRVDAVVLGGGDGAVIDPTCRFKGLAAVGGKPMVEWVVDALREAQLVEGVAVVVPSAEDLGAWADRADKIVVADHGFMGNLVAGMEAFRVDRPILAITGDVPLVEGPALDDFIRSALATGADLAYPVLRKEDVLLQLPGTHRTFIRLATGHVTGGNMAMLNPSLIGPNRELGQRLFAARKSPVGMARVLGLRFVVRLLAGRLEVAELEAKMGQLVGGTGAAVFTRHASIGMDVDKPADADLVEHILRGRHREAGTG
jgi:GTP:adenosylcobinamide-phosphate guanylyltransferase